jgi:hypothetical protein
MSEKISLSYPYADNFNEIMGLQSRLRRTLLDLENYSRHLQEMISALDQEMLRLQHLYGTYQYFYVYRYLFMLRAQLRRFRDNPRYRKNAFNVFHYLMDRLNRLSEDYANGLLEYNSAHTPVRLRDYQIHHDHRPPEQVLPQAGLESHSSSTYRAVPTGLSKKKRRYLHVQIQGLHVLIPYVRYRRISLPQDLLPRSKRVAFYWHSNRYPLVSLLSQDSMPPFSVTTSHPKRGDFVLIDTTSVRFALAYDSLSGRLLDIGSYIHHRLQPSALLLWQGRVVLRDRGYWVLSPKGVRRWLSDL